MDGGGRLGRHRSGIVWIHVPLAKLFVQTDDYQCDEKPLAARQCLTAEAV